MPVILIAPPGVATPDVIDIVKCGLGASFTSRNWNEGTAPDLTVLTTLTNVPKLSPGFKQNFFFLFFGFTQEGREIARQTNGEPTQVFNDFKARV
jgi:hypothetical protein